MFFYMISGSEESLIRKKASIADRVDNARQVMIDNTARSHRKVPDLGVPRLSPRKADSDPGGLQRGKGEICFKKIEMRLFCRSNGVSLLFGRDAKPIKNTENDGSISFHPFIIPN